MKQFFTNRVKSILKMTPLVYKDYEGKSAYKSSAKFHKSRIFLESLQ